MRKIAQEEDTFRKCPLCSHAATAHFDYDAELSPCECCCRAVRGQTEEQALLAIEKVLDEYRDCPAYDNLAVAALILDALGWPSDKAQS